MSLEIKMLLVEDDNTQIQNWMMAVERHNAEDDFSIQLSIVKNKVDAIDFIEKNDIDAAIVDIRLGADQNQDGKEVLLKILESELAVAVILSGESGIEDILPAWNPKVKIIVKAGNGSGITNTMTWLKLQIPMISQIKLAQKSIKREMVKLFTHSIWPRWDAWRSSTPLIDSNETFINDALTRHLTAHIYASFMDKTEERAHPEEWYFVPPLKKTIRTGDIIKNENGTFEIVITPRCDLARDDKNETYQLVECKVVATEWAALCHKLNLKKVDLANNQDPTKAEGFQGKIDEVMESIRRFTQHKNNSNVFHFLPQIKMNQDNNLGPFLVQFDKLRSVKRSEAGIKEYILDKRVATVAPEFLPSLIERLGAFFSRFGTPDYSHPH